MHKYVEIGLPYSLCFFFSLSINLFSDVRLENQPTTLITSRLFQCNLFRLVPDGTNSAAQCLVCKMRGVVRFIKGRTTSNYHFHMKVNMNTLRTYSISVEYFTWFFVFSNSLTAIACC